MNWAWALRLKPNVKFVLMALADACDDDGYCWPSVPTLAKKTCLDDRSVQRILNQLKADGLLWVEPRYRKDGSPTSNGYRLSLNPPGDKLSPPLPAPCHQVVTPVPPPGGSRVTLTTTEHTNQSQPPPPQSMPKPAGESSGRGLIYPKPLSPNEVATATRQLATLPPMLAQALLDELAGRLNAHTVRGAPLSYLRALIARAEAGTFTPEAGVRVAQARERQQKPPMLKQRDYPVRVPPCPAHQSEHLARIRQVLFPKTDVNA
ncbi:MAG: helix-turn-helix domain-containing protein [Acidiferrobacterales bacterium]